MLIYVQNANTRELHLRLRPQNLVCFMTIVNNTSEDIYIYKAGINQWRVYVLEKNRKDDKAT